MATIGAGQIMGLSRPAALEFSFFLSIPVMFAATLFKLAQYVAKEPVAMSNRQWGILTVGFVVSFVVALAVVHFFMHWVRRHGFVPFAIWRFAVGAGVLVWLTAR
jgi:undecaprenyl-diphosphatase